MSTTNPFMQTVFVLAMTLGTPTHLLAQHDGHDHGYAQDPAGEPGDTSAKPQEGKATTVSDPYPLGTCPVSGQRLGSMGEPVARIYDGREVRFCCEGCIERFERNQRDFMKKMDEQIVRQQMAFYPLTSCVVSGEPLSENGEDFAINFVFGNRLFRLCCKDCVKAVRKHPVEMMRRLDAAVMRQQRDSYPLDTCPVSGEALDAMGEAHDVVIANRLIRLCCKSCEKGLRSRPGEILETLDRAWKARGMPHPSDGTAHERTHDETGHESHQDEHDGPAKHGDEHGAHHHGGG